MNEADVARKINRILRKYGYKTDTNRDAVICHRCNAKIIPESGKPDVTVMHPYARSLYVEYKVIRVPRQKSFGFNEIKPDQREKLNEWAFEYGGLCYLGLGVIDVSKKRNRFVTAYLVDWKDWLGVEQAITPIQASLPYDISTMKRVSKGLRPDKDIVHLLSDWELIRASRRWYLPSAHSAIPSVRGGQNRIEETYGTD